MVRLSTIWKLSSRSKGSSLTSDRGVFCEPKPSIDSRIIGEDASDEVELGNRECTRTKTVGVMGAEESSSDGVDEVER